MNHRILMVEMVPMSEQVQPRKTLIVKNSVLRLLCLSCDMHSLMHVCVLLHASC
jgi:hypothetical protein